MTSQTLLEARKYEETTETLIGKEDRPIFHLSTRTGWMNDPNGFSVYKGEYHLFYQYHPYDSHWGPMHWGHAVSTDLLCWRYLPAALAPDTLYDKDGCFSGSAITLDDGRQMLMYTGVCEEPQPDGTKKGIQTQCLAVGDGTDYEKYPENPVLTKNDIPEDASQYDFRDPKVWRVSDGTYRCIVGSRPADGSGQILLYESKDAFHWNFKKIFARNQSRFGRMWECPDFFALDGKWVLLTSPQDMLPQDFEYHNGNGTLCLIGSYDDETETFIEEQDQAIDYGIDFYAPQTILTEDGRRVMIGWMQNWDTCDLHMENRNWCGQMSIPRELSIRNGRLYQEPVRELKQLRHNEVRYQDVLVDGICSLDGIRGRIVELEVEIEPEDKDALYRKFAIRFAQNEIYHTKVSYRLQESTLKIDRKFSGSRRAIIHQRRAKVSAADGKIKLRLILDRYSVEVFVNDGEKAMTATLYTDQEADGISFMADGKVRMNVVKWDLMDE